MNATKQSLVSYALFMELFLGYTKKKESHDELHQHLKNFIFNGNWAELKEDFAEGCKLFDKIKEGITTYEEGFSRISDDIIKLEDIKEQQVEYFIEMCLIFYSETSESDAVVWDAFNDNLNLITTHKEYNRLSFLEPLYKGFGNDLMTKILDKLYRKDKMKLNLVIDKENYLIVKTSYGYFTNDDGTIYPFSVEVTENDGNQESIEISWDDDKPEHNVEIEIELRKRF
jgi:hypothetical protein